MRTARLAIDPARISPSKALARLARAGGALVVVTARMFGDLAAELGGHERAARHLARVATTANKPICVNFATGPDTSRTIAIGPTGWTEEKTAGWIAPHREALEATFGAATPIWEDA